MGAVQLLIVKFIVCKRDLLFRILLMCIYVHTFPTSEDFSRYPLQTYSKLAECKQKSLRDYFRAFAILLSSDLFGMHFNFLKIITFKIHEHILNIFHALN